MPTQKLSSKEAIILSLLSKHSELYGLEIVSLSNNQVGRGTVYVTLSRMEKKRLVESRQEAQNDSVAASPRRLYKITNIGKAAMP